MGRADGGNVVAEGDQLVAIPELTVVVGVLVEAVVLCLFGGVLGVSLALVLSYFLSGLMDVPWVFSPTTALIAFAFCALLGVAFGYYPARRASKLDPIDALRHE